MADTALRFGLRFDSTSSLAALRTVVGSILLAGLILLGSGSPDADAGEGRAVYRIEWMKSRPLLHAYSEIGEARSVPASWRERPRDRYSWGMA